MYLSNTFDNYFYLSAGSISFILMIDCLLYLIIGKMHKGFVLGRSRAGRSRYLDMDRMYLGLLIIVYLAFTVYGFYESYKGFNNEHAMFLNAWEGYASLALWLPSLPMIAYVFWLAIVLVVCRKHFPGVDAWSILIKILLVFIPLLVIVLNYDWFVRVLGKILRIK